MVSYYIALASLNLLCRKDWSQTQEIHQPLESWD